MKVISKFSHPEDVKEIENYLIKKGYSINCNLEILEKLWYAFSEGYAATWLIPDDYLIEKFIDYAEDIDIKTAKKMDYYGNIIGKED
jgi:hypothetical protein